MSAMIDELNREREGLQLAKLFLDYCFNVSDMIPASSPDNIIKNLKEYGLKICDDCGGAMCDLSCPVSRYLDDMDKWLKGEKTIFTRDFSKTNIDVKK